MLQQIEMKVMSNDVCRPLQPTITDKQICVKGERGTGMCHVSACLNVFRELKVEIIYRLPT